MDEKKETRQEVTAKTAAETTETVAEETAAAAAATAVAETPAETLPAKTNPAQPAVTGKPAAGKKKRKKKRTGLKIVIFLLLVCAALIGAYLYMKKNQAVKASAAVAEVQTATAARRDISSELTASSSLAPKDTYDITSLVEGEILEAPFEEGDRVEKDQVLYRIDTSSMDTELTTTQNSLTRAEESLQTAQEDYDEAAAKYSGNTYKATDTGYIKTLYVKEGDQVSGSTKIADIYNDSVMKLRVPFLSAEAAQIPVGAEVLITLEDTGEILSGSVKSVSNMEETLAGGRLVRYVTAEVTNPGGLTADMTAVATVGEFTCSEDGTFEPTTDTVMNADISGNSLEIQSMLVSEGDYIGKGAAVFSATEKSMEKLLRSYKDSVDKAKETLESAQNKLNSTQDDIENYTVTAPISGTVISKTGKVGDKVAKSSSGSSTLAVIYDLSTMTFEMSVDELDVNSVKVGQTVAVTADAVEGETFTGTVTNVSLQSSYSNGVTNYPVTVTLESTGALLPGMNVDAKIILDSSEQALCVPAGSLMRGNKVYIKDDTVTEKQGSVPAGFRAVEVTTGVVNDDYVELLSGVSEGDVVYVDPSAGKTTTTMWQMSGPYGPESGGMAPGGGSGNRNR